MVMYIYICNSFFFGGAVAWSVSWSGFIVLCKTCFLEPVSWSLCRMRFHGWFHGRFHGLFAGRGFMAGFMVGVVAGLGQERNDAAVSVKKVLIAAVLIHDLDSSLHDT